MYNIPPFPPAEVPLMEVAVLKVTDFEPVPSKKKRPPLPATEFDMKVEAPIVTVEKVEVGEV